MKSSAGLVDNDRVEDNEGCVRDDERWQTTSNLHDDDAYLNMNNALLGADQGVELPANIHQSTQLPKNRHVAPIITKESNGKKQIAGSINEPTHTTK
mmetsp:Transcript_27884/g.28305  ORF Transcript_27884/g.28305 Transcript_27884/m.28305 type:complete len:97 (+) Transcript_27884:894-1184(+)